MWPPRGHHLSLTVGYNCNKMQLYTLLRHSITACHKITSGKFNILQSILLKHSATVHNV